MLGNLVRKRLMGRTREPAAVPRTRAHVYGRLSLAGQFLLASLLIVVVGGLVIGIWVGRQLQDGVLNRTAAITALYVSSVASPHLQPLASRSWLDPTDVGALDDLILRTPLGQGIVSFKVWSMDGTVLYSPNRALIGRRFGVDDSLARATRGEVVADVSNLQAAENVYERQHWHRLVEVYSPVRAQGEGRTIAVMEFYQLPNELDSAVATAQHSAWVVVALVMLAMFLLLVGIVKRGSDTITHQERALRQKVLELSQLLRQNTALHERVRQAAGRTTALNEQALQRIGADLHDGPGQALALALLRLDAVEELASAGTPANRDLSVVHGAVRDALTEMRSISSGLRLPELEPLSIAEVAGRAIRDHERRSGTAVMLEIGQLPEQAPLPIKIALFRSLQEALSNATRHGRGAGVRATLRTQANLLVLSVSDQGPGFRPEEVEGDGHLGLAGMRERAELLGGTFSVDSTAEHGTTVVACWPLRDVEGA